MPSNEYSGLGQKNAEERLQKRDEECLQKRVSHFNAFLHHHSLGSTRLVTCPLFSSLGRVGVGEV